jgi:hypothetical protein
MTHVRSGMRREYSSRSVALAGVQWFCHRRLLSQVGVGIFCKGHWIFLSVLIRPDHMPYSTNSLFVTEADHKPSSCSREEFFFFILKRKTTVYLFACCTRRRWMLTYTRHRILSGCLVGWKVLGVTSNVLWDVERDFWILIKKTNYIIRLETARRFFKPN